MSLRETYDAAAAVLRGHGVTPDSFRIVQEVEALRESWRPDKPCTLLLAESHVATREEDFKLRLDGRILRQHGLEDYPSHFVRFVYCLAAGETEMLPAGAGPENRSKWQFWRLLWSCENDPRKQRFDLTRKATPNFNARITKKVRLLRALQRRGIWLLDACIIGINGQKADVKHEATSVSWESYVGPRIHGLNPRPKRIVVIGAAVADTVFESRSRQGIWSGIPYEVVNQPQGDRSRESTLKTLVRVHQLAAGCV